MPDDLAWLALLDAPAPGSVEVATVYPDAPAPGSVHVTAGHLDAPAPGSVDVTAEYPDAPAPGSVHVTAEYPDAPAPGSVHVTAGHLVVRVGRAKPHRDAVRIEPGLVGDGPAWAVSLVLPPREARPLFDDPAVVAAMKAVLRDPGRTPVFSTLVDGSTRWAGALSGIAPAFAAGRPAWWSEDPFARLGLQHRLLVPPGVLRSVAVPVGPGHQRHAGAPWPWGRFIGTAIPR